MKTLFVILTGLFVCLSSLACADAEQQLRVFATCAGRLSAMMEHQWMFDGAASERTKRHRADVLDLLAATMPEGRGREVLHWRLSAKLAQSTLLTRATFNEDIDDADWAKKTAARLTQECTSFLLS